MWNIMIGFITEMITGLNGSSMNLQELCVYMDTYHDVELCAKAVVIWLIGLFIGILLDKPVKKLVDKLIVEEEEA